MQRHTVWRGMFMAAGLCAVFPLMAASSSQEQTMNAIRIEIDGTPGTAFSARWTIKNDGEIQEYREPDGRVPASLKFEGSGVEGHVELLSDGQLDVTVSKNGNRSRSSTQGKGSTLNIGVSSN